MSERRPVRARCLQGGTAPCFDDLCHGVDTTMCGLEHLEDFCDHGWLPDTCDEGCREEAFDDEWPDS